MKLVLRLLALIVATVCGIAFLIDIATLLLNYNYKHHRFLPFIVERSYITDTIWFGVGFVCSVILYLYSVRKMRPISR
jgi:hypothetical protein